MSAQEGIDLYVIIDVAIEPYTLKLEVVSPPSFEGMRFARDLGERESGESPSERPDDRVMPCHCSPWSFPADFAMSMQFIGSTPIADGVCGLEEAVVKSCRDFVVV